MRYRFQTLEFGALDVHLRTLRSTNEYDDVDGEAEALGVSPEQWPLFGVVWPASIVLAALMVEEQIEGRRILEAGCGIGLASLLLALRGADITAMDKNPEAGRFLAYNAGLNELDEIPFHCADWQSDGAEMGTFDLILGSDLLYGGDRAEGLAGFIDRRASACCTMVLVDPGRGQANRFSRLMAARGFEHSVRHAAPDESLHFGRDIGARIQIHRFERG